MIEFNYNNGNKTTLDDSTIVFAIDETGHEDFLDVDQPFFGIGGCAFMVSDYQRLIETPFNFMCKKYFPLIKRPFHTADISQNITKPQIEAINHFVTKFQFFRIAVMQNTFAQNSTGIPNYRLIAKMFIQKMVEILKHAKFTRIVIIYEDSQRLTNKMMSVLSNHKVKCNNIEVPIETFVMPKNANFVALEVADLIMHTAGRQTRHRVNTKGKGFLPDYKKIFKHVDPRLISFSMIEDVERIL